MEQKPRSAEKAQGPGGNNLFPEGELVLQVGIQSDVGPSRSLNEDHADYCIPKDDAERKRKGVLFVVADGMGGHQAGEVASQEAVRIVLREYYASEGHPPGDSLVRAIKLANRTLYAQAYSDAAQGGMGTTMVAAAVLGRKVYVANVGDSRAYILNEQGIAQITEDHSWVEEQVQAGLLTREQASKHPQRNLITRALGSRASVDVDLFEGELGEGNVLLLCTDGLSGPLTEKQIVQVVRAHAPAPAAEHLVALAGAQGGDDNATTIIVEARQPRPPTEALEDQAPTVVSESPPAPRTRFSIETIVEQLAGLRDRHLREPRTRWVIVLVPLVVMVCLCGAGVFMLLSGDLGQKATAAPHLAPIHDPQMDNMDMEQLAERLGYRSIGEMSTEQGGLAAAGFWPAQRGLFLAGKANDQACTDRVCSFDIEMAGVVYAISYQPEGGDRPQLDGRLVRVFGYQQDNNGLQVMASLIERNSAWWSFRQPRWEIVYQTASLDQTVWVYGTVDEPPYGILAPGTLPGLAKGARVLLWGQWQIGADPPVFHHDQVYLFDGNGYVIPRGENQPREQPTVTLEPITTQKPGP
jgi:serine/threonine protein phosphatase PrpC